MQGKSRKSNVTFRILNIFLDWHHRFRLNDKTSKSISPRPGIEPGPSTWQAEILTTRLSRIINRWEYVYNNVIGVEETMKSVISQWQHNTYCSNAGVLYINNVYISSAGRELTPSPTHASAVPTGQNRYLKSHDINPGFDCSACRGRP